ncbi:MAG: hypothetical protein ACO23M_11900 [Vulcanococcus sp.]|jgi:hypothetical protein
MEAAIFILVSVTLFKIVVWINRYFYKRSHRGNLGRERDYVYHYSHRGGLKGITEKEPDPLPRTELVLPPETHKRPPIR